MSKATTSSSSLPSRHTHIEVCVRLRPLIVEMNTSSSSFFHDNHNHSSSSTTTTTASSSSSSMIQPPSSTTHSIPRKPSIPRPIQHYNVSSSSITNKHHTMSKVSPLKNTSTNITNSGTPTKSVSNEYTQHIQQQQSLSLSSSIQKYAWTVQGDDTVIQNSDCGTELIVGRTHSYTLDHVYGPTCTTSFVYEQSIKSKIYAAMDGYHAAILAYGQTATGKTHTMTGTCTEPGFIPLAIRECFAYIHQNRKQQQKGGSTSPISHSDRGSSSSSEYLLRLSYLEVYKETIKDLLCNATSSGTTTTTTSSNNNNTGTNDQATPIRLYESNGQIQIVGLKEIVVTSPEQVFHILAQGESRRHVGSTHYNIHSSRSHVIVRLWIESRTVDSTNTLQETVRVSSLSLVDLAGSESVRLSGSIERKAEGRYINKSLMTLGQVVFALSEQEKMDMTNGESIKRQHVPYRDSKLTRLLQPCLSGNAQVVLLCCISPLPSHIEESHNTFKFATRAKKIPQKAIKQEQSSLDDLTLLQSYRAEIEDLKQQLKEAQEMQKQQQLQFQTKGAVSNILDDGTDTDDEYDMKELIVSIQKMEKLILKSQPLQSSDDDIHHYTTNEIGDDDDDDDNLLLDTGEIGDGMKNNNSIVTSSNKNDIESRLLALTVQPSTPETKMNGYHSTSNSNNSSRYNTPPRHVHTTIKKSISNYTKNATNGEALHQELARIQGLLGSVMKKRQRVNNTVSSVSHDKEVQNLRAALQQQEVATSLRQADSSFLQSQLEEKDNLLIEVSKLLETVEERQTELEKENQRLQNEIEVLKQQLAT